MQPELDREDLTASDWKHMYCILLWGMEAALERLSAGVLFAARRALETSMDEAEEYYISAGNREN